MKDKNFSPVLHGFIEIVNTFKRQPNKLWIDWGREFYNKLTQKWLNDKNTLIYSNSNEGNSVVAERLIRTLKSKIYKQTES